MKPDEIWESFLVKVKYAGEDIWNFLLFKLAIWILAGAIIGFLETKEFFEKTIKKRK